MNNGWICLHRKINEWEWYDDVNVCRLFIHLLLTASHKDKKYRGKVIPKGSLRTGRLLLSKQTGLSERQIRTALSKLKSTNEVTIKTASKYSIISITKWDQYQDIDQQYVQQATSKRPTNDQQATTYNNVNNVNNVNKKHIGDLSIDKSSQKVPYDEIVKMYHEKLPMLPTVVKLTEKRKKQIKVLWNAKNDGLPELRQWENFFIHVSKSRFLTGKTDNGVRRPFIANLEWITNYNNFIKISEDHYHG